MKRFVRLASAFLFASVLAVGVSTTAAVADSPHFLKYSFSVDKSTGDLLCTFKEAGLGSTQGSADITCTATDSTAVYQCFNNGGHHPHAGNKETVAGSVTNSGSFPIRNGQTSGTIRVNPVSQGDFTCPPGQTLYLVSACYGGIILSGEGATVGPFYNDGDRLCVTGLMIRV